MTTHRRVALSSRSKLALFCRSVPGTINPRPPQPRTPMNTLSPQLRIANTAAVLDGPYGAVTQQAARSGVCRQALYRDAPKVLQAVDGSATQRHLQDLQDAIDRLHAE